MQEAQRAREEGERRRRERGYDRRYRDRYKDRYRRVCTIGITPFKFFMISFVSFGCLMITLMIKVIKPIIGLVEPVL